MILNEASFKWRKKNPFCISYYTAKESTFPSIAFMNPSTQLTEATWIDIVLFSTTKITKLLREFATIRYAEDHPNYSPLKEKISKILQATASNNAILSNLEYFKSTPELYKVVRLNGRERIFRYLTTDLKMPLVYYVDAFGEVSEAEGTDHSEHVEYFHGAKLFFPEAMRENRRIAMRHMLGKVYDHLKQVNLTNIFKCDIRFATQLMKTAGRYHIDTKDIRIQPNAEDSDAVVYTLIHEYGHKHFFETLSADQRAAIKNKFDQLGVEKAVTRTMFRKEFRSVTEFAKQHFSAGTTLEWLGKNTKKLQRTDTFVVRSFVGDELKFVNLRNKIVWTAHFNKQGAEHFFDKWAVNGKKISPPDELRAEEISDRYHAVSDQWFPTLYSTTNCIEWYAESFAFYVLNHLHGKPKDFFAQFIESSN